MNMYEYNITTHRADEILAKLQETAEPRKLYCDSDGVCFFDDAPNSYTAAIIEILNEHGERGWELTQVVLREQDVICFWKRAL